MTVVKSRSRSPGSPVMIRSRSPQSISPARSISKTRESPRRPVERRRSISRSRSRSRDSYRRDRDSERYRRRSPPPRAWSPPEGVTREKPSPSKVLGVFGLSSRTREDDLEEKFGKFGKTEKVMIIYNQKSNESRCYGFVYYENIEDATNARKELNGINLHGRKIRVDFSITQKAHNPTPGKYMGNIQRRDSHREYRPSHRSRSYRRSRSRSRTRSRSRSRSRSSHHRRRRRRSRSDSLRRH